MRTMVVSCEDHLTTSSRTLLPRQPRNWVLGVNFWPTVSDADVGVLRQERSSVQEGSSTEQPFTARTSRIATAALELETRRGLLHAHATCDDIGFRIVLSLDG